MRSAATALAFALAGVAPALAAEEPVELKKDAGLEAVQNNCSACHSLDYIVMNSPYPDAKLWEAEVAKMINAYGAPIGAADARAIAAYLARNYGR